MKLYQIKKYVKKKNTLISGNAGDEKNLQPNSWKFTYFKSS